MNKSNKFIDTGFPDLNLIKIEIFTDKRGIFMKPFQKSSYKNLMKGKEFVESYFSLSKKNVIRGMHFQKPPEDHIKIVYISKGEIVDVVLDIRDGSPTYGKVFSTMLSADKGIGIFIPPGFAHGFKVISDIVIVNYLQTTEYSHELDSGILWNSISYNWDIIDPVMSERDRSFITFNEYSKEKNDFLWEG